MGSFINSQADNEICEVLNKRFSDQVIPGGGRTYIAALRDHFQKKENFLDANHRLHRVFHRLAISVTGGPRVPKAQSKPIPLAVSASQRRNTQRSPTYGCDSGDQGPTNSHPGTS